MQEKELINAIKSQTRILSREFERQWDNFKGIISKKEAACVETETKCSILDSADANETFRVAREGQKLMNEEMTRINTDIVCPPTFVPRLISPVSIESVHGWLKKNHNKPVVAAIEIRANEFKAVFCLKSVYDGYVSNDILGDLDTRICVPEWKASTSVLLKPNGTVVGIINDTLGNLTANADVKADQYVFEHLGRTLYDKQVDGTTNITVHEVTGPRFVKEIYRGDRWQGNSLAFEDYSSFLNQLCRLDVISILKEHEHIKYDDMLHCFESAIRNFKLESTKRVNLTIPIVSLEKLTSVPLRELTSHSNFNTNVIGFGDKLRFTSSFFRTFFENSIKYVSGILDECIHAINKENLSEMTTVFVVGECSQSPILTDVIKQKFGPSTEVIVESSQNAVLVEALLCGFQ
ncbi:unnamed protein product [Mytilus coruscus]|uniref:Uncharacterized protein n=1 Tax=Mytilus coruscus TaxID=42192 RepID=A0A6J8EVW4_MYTCO|nr:unnamed protein product [Mytilus coruscus]